MIENKQEITKITYYGKSKNFCPMGNDWYTNNFVVYILPDKLIPDYCQIDNYIKEEINGKKLIIEDAIEKLFNFILLKYKVNYLKIESHVDDAAHSKVIIEKERY